jgi:hypothetical protein
MKIPETTEYELIPPGTYPATCVEFTDLGTQETKYGLKRQIRLGWEISGQLMKTGKPFIVSRIFTFSANVKATLRPIIEGMTGKKFDSAFDTKSLIGCPCLVSVQHNDNGDATFANVEAVVSAPSGSPAPNILSEPIYFSLDPDEFDEAVFRKLPEKRQAKIGATPEWMNLVATKKLRGLSSSEKIGGDSIPF